MIKDGLCAVSTLSDGEFSREKHLIHIERSFPGDTKASLINKWIGIGII